MQEKQVAEALTNQGVHVTLEELIQLKNKQDGAKIRAYNRSEFRNNTTSLFNRLLCLPPISSDLVYPTNRPTKKHSAERSCGI
jgi:hypothetical protein